MNPRLEIASRVLASLVANSSFSGVESSTLAGWALEGADALIKLEKETRKPLDPNSAEGRAIQCLLDS